MNYTEGLAKLKDTLGRTIPKRRLCRNTILFQQSDGSLVIKLHSTEILTFWPDGRFTVKVGGWATYTTKARIGQFIPRDYHVYSESQKYGSSWVLYYNGAALATLDASITVFPDGKTKGGGSVSEALELCKNIRNKRQRERYKVRYWILKAMRGGKSRKPLTPAIIQAEPNVTVRTAMVKVYGVEQFLTDISAEVIDKEGEYELLKYPMTGWAAITALRMVCPSTKTVYIHPVPPGLAQVAEALDWMFDTPGFRQRLASES